MSDRYSANQKTVPISTDSLKSRETGKYEQPAADTASVGTGEISLKVLLGKSSEGFYVTSDSAASISGINFEPSRGITIKLSAGGTIIANGRDTLLNRVEIISPSGSLKFNRKSYRGSFLIFSNVSNMMLVNKVELENYLYGVLPFEVSTKWPAEVLKAQAVAARTFAIYNKLNNKMPEYDLDSNVNSQVYGGMDKESPTTNAAIDGTKGEVLAFNGAVIQAFFHANSGGKTASSREVWGGNLNYLSSVDDPYSAKGRGYKWNAVISRDKISSILTRAGYKAGTVYELLVQDKTESGRVKTLKIKGSENEYIIKAKDLRTLAGPDRIRSTNFSVSVEGNSFYFEGFGWGHGVGMSQEGAREMAEEGWGYKEILDYYYRGAKLKKIRIE
jgi:stage II sporulation protein D